MDGILIKELHMTKCHGCWHKCTVAIYTGIYTQETLGTTLLTF